MSANTSRKRVVFMGTPDFAVPALEALAAHHDVVAVYSQPPRPAGRGKEERPSAVQVAAESLGLKCRHPTGLKGADTQAEFTALHADVAVVVAYGLILPKAILHAPRHGCLNIHASLLPRWRGAAPIHRAVMAGDSQTGISIMQMDEGLDTGAVLLHEALSIAADDTTADLHDRLAVMGARMVVAALDGIDWIPRTPQSAKGVTYAAKIDKAEARVDWNRPAAEVDRLVRGLSPFPGAWTEVAGERIKLLRTALAQGTAAPGTVIDGFTVACGQDAVRVTQAQRQGKRPMDADELLRGLALPARLT
jgi:methionyl-tRNA formyltransferase